MTDAITGIAELRILIVEDEMLIAMDIEGMLIDLQCEPVGPVSTINSAIEIIRSDAKIDGVLLDMNLGGEPVHPVVDELVAKDIAFVLVTGYARRDDDPPAMRDAPRLNKPFRITTLSETISKAFT